MANICIVSHTIYPATAPSEEALKELQELQKLMTRFKAEENTEHSPLYRLVDHLEGNACQRQWNMRSDFDAPSLGVRAGTTIPILTFYEDTSNTPCLFAWAAVMQHFPLLEHAWAASEPGNREYSKCDPDNFFYADQQYVVFASDEEDEDEKYGGKEFASRKDICEYIVKLYGPAGPENFDMAVSRAQAQAERNGGEFTVYVYENA